jgi:hypothetical protein
VFAANVDDLFDDDTLANGYIRFTEGLKIYTNGGDIILGGGDQDGAGYAIGGNEVDKYTGIRLDKSVVLHSGGGNIQVKGKSFSVNTTFAYAGFGVGFWDSSVNIDTIQSGTGTITIDGFSNSFGADGYTNSGIYAREALYITSANTTENAIQIIGKATKNTGDVWGLETFKALSLIATGVGGGITISTSQRCSVGSSSRPGTGGNFDAVFRGETNFLAKEVMLPIRVSLLFTSLCKSLYILLMFSTFMATLLIIYNLQTIFQIVKST